MSDVNVRRQSTPGDDAFDDPIAAQLQLWRESNQRIADGGPIPRPRPIPTPPANLRQATPTSPRASNPKHNPWTPAPGRARDADPVDRFTTHAGRHSMPVLAPLDSEPARPRRTIGARSAHAPDRYSPPPQPPAGASTGSATQHLAESPAPTTSWQTFEPAPPVAPAVPIPPLASAPPRRPEPFAAQYETADQSLRDGPLAASWLPDPRAEERFAASSDYAIEAVNLHKRFKDMVAVEDVSFRVPTGSIVALLGPNGAGKTTTVNMLCTLLRPDGGHAVVGGHDIVKQASDVRKSIMLTGQFAALDESLTGRENLILFGRLLGLRKSEAKARADELLDHFSLTEAGGKRVGQYSGGMRRRIDIACGLVTSPKVVFLDEPTTGLDPRSRQDVWALIQSLKATGVTTLLTTQYLEEADMLSDNIVVIDKGRVIAEGTSDDLKTRTGAAYCDVTPEHGADLPRLRHLLADLVGDQISNPDDLTISVPAPDGANTLVEVVRRTTEAGLELSDITMRRPSLDEVFLHLTDPARDGS
ncbi:ATP-binding cassette domain-containing protein [Gordonia sp. CPCC 205333]|uniref:ATP-binding cassette domain-containing protein n=1 Tax=Gordonia sp. CPCC 205333 TaxID=3140790 RepID=UPI003AF3D387